MNNDDTQGGVMLNSTRTRLILIGILLCAALFVFVGCPDAPNTAPVITLTGDAVIVVAIGADFTDPGIDVSNNQPAYTGVVTTAITDSAGATIPEINTAIAGTYTITYTAPADADRNTPATITRTVRVGVDIDFDNLIDINTIDDLNVMRHDLDGTAYQATADGTELQCGTDGTTACTGYELMRDLNFANGDSYASGTVNPAWRPTGGDPDTATNAGWEPIGSCNTDTNSNSLSCNDGDDTPFAARFVGNGFTISNLYARNVEASGAGVGLFGLNGGAMESIGIVDANIYGGGGSDFIGGLIGWNIATGTTTDSYATGGGVNGGDGNDFVGGLIGFSTAPITASYATGNVDGGDGGDRIGGLIGFSTAPITASYATGNVDGGGDEDFVGGLVGNNSSDATITASYATGNVDGGVGGDDRVGELVGSNLGDTTASYGFGMATGNEETTVPLTRSTDATTALTSACALTQANSSTTMDNRWTPAQWDFGTTMQRPVLQDSGAIIAGQTDRDCN